MTMKYLVGLDIGTSGAKCIIVDQNGKVVASSTQGYPLYTPRPGWAEQNPEDWWQAVLTGLKEIVKRANVDPKDFVGVGFSGQMHGLVAFDENDAIIRPAILWCDQRTQKQCDWLHEQCGGIDGILKYTNNPMLTGYTGGKILWLKEEEPENFARMKSFVCPKDYIRYRMTGVKLIDVSDASGTGFFDTRNRVWSDELIKIAGLDKKIFPEAVESTALAGRVTKEVAEATGLPEGLACYAGGGDAVVQATGSGLVRPGILGVVIGTAGNVSMGLTHYQDNPHGDLQMFCSNEPGLWVAIGGTLAAGGSYRWYRDTLCEGAAMEAKETGGNVYDIMGKQAAESVPGANGVIFAPYLTGERCPYPDPNARGSFYGLSLKTTRGDITRAVMEGVTFSLNQIIDIFRGFSENTKVYSSGGGAASELWRQIQADIIDLPVYTMSAASEGGAYGAVLIAGVGAGLWENLGEAVKVLREETETFPIPENQEGYRKSYEIYKKIYPTLKPLYDFSAEQGY